MQSVDVLGDDVAEAAAFSQAGQGLMSPARLHIADMFADPQAIARGLRMDLNDGRGNTIPNVRSPILLPETPLNYHRPSPRLGEHTDEILAELEKSRT